MVPSPGPTNGGQLGWEHHRLLLATQHTCGWLGTPTMAANWRTNDLYISNADFAHHCQAVVELVEYRSQTKDMSILPQVTAAIDCVFRFGERSIQHDVGVSPKCPCTADTFPQLARMVLAYQAVTFDFQYTDRLEQFRERTCSVR